MKLVANTKPSILVVEDDKHICDIIKFRLEKNDYFVNCASSAESALEILKEREFDIILLDIILPGKSGLEVLHYVKNSSSITEVIIMTASDSINVPVEGIKAKAFDYISKPINFELLDRSIEKAFEKTLVTRHQFAVNRLVRGKFPVIISASHAMKQVLEVIEKSAPTNSSLLLLGETGTGKELIARRIHLKSARQNAAFVPINCAGLPETLIESELFGHEKGAFTGATATHRGLFEIAHKGTLFMDEIGEMSLTVQAKLLRVLESGEFRRIGGTTSLYSDVRMITATNRDLQLLIKEGKFREDLFYRLATLVINLPPLRERREDIEHLARYFVEVLSQDTNKQKTLSSDVIKELEKYNWPGNVRELRNFIERLVLLSEKDVIDLCDFSKAMQLGGQSNNNHDKNLTLDEIEKEYIKKAIANCNGNLRAAARSLGISHMTLYRRLKQYNINYTSTT